MHNKNTHEEWHTVIILSSQTMNTLKLVTLKLVTFKLVTLNTAQTPNMLN